MSGEVKRFVVFTGNLYYPDGGWSDFRSSHDTFEAARDEAESNHSDWWQVVDLTTGIIVASRVHS